MKDRLLGKHIVVTAAGQGIGRAIVDRCLEEGAEVVAIDINEQALLRPKNHSLRTVVVDMTDETAVGRTFAKLPLVDGLVNAVGWVHHGTLLDVTTDDWRRAFRTNCDSAFFAIRAVLPGMAARGGGSIVNIASIASSVKAAPLRAAYSATKAAMIGMTKSVAADFVGQQVRCNAICPGTVQTPSLEERLNALPDPAAARAHFLSRQPNGRLGRPEEVAALCCHLLADESAFMTGSVLVMDPET